MRRPRGVTMIELLTVVAIIAILAAITFPVFARMKEGAFRSSDLSHISTIRTALLLYRADQGGFPPQLLGYVSTYSGDPMGNDVVPADRVYGFLYPKRVGSIHDFQPSPARFSLLANTTAEWPRRDPRGVGSAPILDLNGDGRIDALDDVAGARQRFGPGDQVMRPNPNGNNMIPARFYKIDGYDVAPVGPTVETQDAPFQLRYTLFWTDWGLGGGNAFDDPRQLGYADPPESTVVTWNSYYRDWRTSGEPQRIRKDQVLFLGGNARPYDSRDLFDRSWRVMP